jgi:asparaginyl-tRNA synthetase
MRNQMAYAIHTFFQERGFQYVHTPLITTSDCEGAGAMFQVTTLDLEALAKSGKGVDYSKDFFDKKAYLTVSGQLNVEAYCMALSRVYTFGPTFRARDSNTTRHLAEFWMVEPEFAFGELADDIALAETFSSTCSPGRWTNAPRIWPSSTSASRTASSRRSRGW